MGRSMSELMKASSTSETLRSRVIFAGGLEDDDVEGAGKTWLPVEMGATLDVRDVAFVVVSIVD